MAASDALHSDCGRGATAALPSAIRATRHGHLQRCRGALTMPWRCRHSAQVEGGRRGGLGGLAFSRGGRGGRRRSGAGDYGAARGLGAVKALSGLSCPAGGPARPRGQREHGFSFLLFLSKSLSCVASLFAFTLAHSTVRVWPASARGKGSLLSGKYPRNPWKSSLLSVPARSRPWPRLDAPHGAQGAVHASRRRAAGVFVWLDFGAGVHGAQPAWPNRVGGSKPFYECSGTWGCWAGPHAARR